MKYKELEKISDKLELIDKKSLILWEPDLNNLNNNIKYWTKNKGLIRSKNSLYTLKSKYEKVSDKDYYIEFISNQLLKPSYLSLEYVLAKYQILSEAVFVLTSVSYKASREFNNEIAIFSYQYIPKKLFTGFHIKNNKVAITTKAKALFDFLYLRFKQLEINKTNLKSLRLNLEYFNGSDKKELNKYFKLLNKDDKWQKLYNLITNYDAS